MAGSDLIGLLRVDGKWMGQLLKSEMDTERPMKRPETKWRMTQLSPNYIDSQILCTYKVSNFYLKIPYKIFVKLNYICRIYIFKIKVDQDISRQLKARIWLLLVIFSGI